MQKPYEFLVRWNTEGALQGAHVIFQETLTDSLGNVTPVIHPAQPVAIGEQQGFPLEDVLGEVNAAALKTIDELKQTHQDEIAAATAANNTVVQQLQDAHQAEMSVLKQELDALKNPPIPSVEWAEFRLAMLSNDAYQRIAIGVINVSGIGNWTVTTLQNAVSMENPRVEILSQFWNAMMLLIPQGLEPTETEINIWNGIALQAKVPFSFDSVGLITQA